MDPLWYKDAIIYETHVKAFFDSNGDGIGDFPGCSKNSIICHDWVSPALAAALFPISAARRRVRHRRLRQCPSDLTGRWTISRHFLNAAHERNLQVIIELVINHTSDQHPWFQAARQAPPGSPERDYLRVERYRREVHRRADHFYGHGEIELDLGSCSESLLLAPLLFAPA